MRLYEFLTEDVSKEAATRNITDILSTELPVIFNKLEKMATDFEYNNGSIGDEDNNNPKKFAFIMGGQKSQWYKTVYETQMKVALYSLMKYLPKGLKKELSDYLDIMPGGFRQFQDILIPLLARAGQELNNKSLSNGAHAAQAAIKKFNTLVSKLSVEEPSGYDTPKQPKKANPIAGQNQSAEGIINDVLGRIDKKHAGEIRNIVARSDNKLMTLQQELSKRGIKL
jgi:hypothetical protein